MHPNRAILRGYDNVTQFPIIMESGRSSDETLDPQLPQALHSTSLETQFTSEL